MKVYGYTSQVVVLVLALFLLGACMDDGDPPPTELVIVTPAPSLSPSDPSPNYSATIVALQSTNTALTNRVASLEAVQDPQRNPSQTTTPAPTATANIMPTETIRPSNFPTAQAEIISVVEQLFEGGRMLWFRDTRTIAVLVGEGIDPTEGDWLCFEDTFVEGETEFLPTFQPPSDVSTDSMMLTDPLIQQPIRGFGKVWRENPELREELGWALSSETEHSAVVEYVAGGRLVDGEYVPGPGEFRVQSFFDGAMILLYEESIDSPCPRGSWRIRFP